MARPLGGRDQGDRFLLIADRLGDGGSDDRDASCSGDWSLGPHTGQTTAINGTPSTTTSTDSGRPSRQ
jgi:hypothetical protein